MDELPLEKLREAQQVFAKFNNVILSAVGTTRSFAEQLAEFPPISPEEHMQQFFDDEIARVLAHYRKDT